MTKLETAFVERKQKASWVATYVLPHEKSVRRELRRWRASEDEIDEAIQEAYGRLAAIETVDHIDRPGAYFFSVARNVILSRIKRRQIVPMDGVFQIDTLRDDSPSPEREVAGRLDVARILAVIDAMPEPRRRIVRLRKIEDWPQKQIAAHLGMTEKAIEKQIWLGLRTLRAFWAGHERPGNGEMMGRCRSKLRAGGKQ